MPTPLQIKDIAWALAEYRKPLAGSKLTRDVLYTKYLDYYEGRHKLNFATEKFKSTFGDTFQAMAENLCPIVVDTLADRMQLQGFTSANEADAERVSQETAEIERRNRMDQQRGQIYKDLFTYGDNYVIVWPDADDPTWPVIHPNAPGSIVVKYDAKKIGLIVQAAKFWTENDAAGVSKCRLNLYYPDRIEKYVTSSKATGLPAAASAFTEHYEDELWPLPNPYERVPVFAYANNAGVGKPGSSELRDIIAPQDGLNKALCDMLVAMEFEAFAQRWVTGLEVEYDDNGVVIPPFKAGIDRVWNVLSKDAKFGEFSRADLEKFVSVQNNLRTSIARVAGFPLHYFMIGQDVPPSGTSLIVASGRMTSKVEDRQVSIGNTEADIMRFCLKIRGMQNVDVKPLWKDTAPKPDAKNEWDAAATQQQVTGRTQVLREKGYTDDEIAQMAKDRWEEEMGDGAPDLTSGDALPVVDDEPASDPGAAPDAGVATTVTLNGTQITSALQVISQLQTGTIERMAATELLVGVGIPRDRVEAIVEEALNNPIEPQPAPAAAPVATPPIEPGEPE